MTTEYSGFQVGNFVAPLAASTAHSLLQDADPARFAALNFFKAMIALYLGARFDAEVTKAGLPALAGKVSTLAIPCDPMPLLLQAQLEPPFLALFPTRDRFEERTRNWPHVMGDMTLLYVLPPLTPAQYIQLEPFLRAVAKTVHDRLEQGHDPSYAADALFCEQGGIEQISLLEARYGTIQGGLRTELYFPCVEMSLDLRERKMATPGQTTFAGLDAGLTTTDADGGHPLDAADVSEELS